MVSATLTNVIKCFEIMYINIWLFLKWEITFFKVWILFDVSFIHLSYFCQEVPRIAVRQVSIARCSNNRQTIHYRIRDKIDQHHWCMFIKTNVLTGTNVTFTWIHVDSFYKFYKIKKYQKPSCFLLIIQNSMMLCFLINIKLIAHNILTFLLALCSL